MDMTEIRRRSMMSPKSSPQARDYSERGIEACLAVNPLGSIEFQSPSRPKSPLLDGTDPSFWNENWRSTEEDGSIHPDRSEQRVVDDDQEIGFYPPRKFGQRNVNLTAYWSSRFIKAVVTLAATMCIVLAIFRILATMVFLKSDSMFWLLPYFVTLSFISLCIASVHLQDYFERPNEYDTRFLAFLGLFSLHGITDWVKFGFGGALTAWIFAAQLGAYYEGPFLFSRELNKPSKSTTYLNEELFYVIMAGSWVGSYFFLQRHFDISRPFIKFPVVHRRKILEFKSKARPTLKKSARAAIWPTITFTISYHFFFYDIKNSVVSALMFLDSCALEIDHTWYEFLNLRRLFVVYLVSVVVIFLFKMAKGVIRIFLLAPREFGVELFHEEQLELTLTEALGESRLPLVRALAFRYLLEIARSSDAVGKDRRRKIFALNPTGDLPLEWNATKGDCLSCVERFTALLDQFQELVDTKMNDDVAPVLPWQLALQAIHLKNKRERLSECRKAMSLLERLTFESKQILVRMPWLMYILDNRKQNAFIRATRNCQEVLYSVRALSCLVANSVAEDRYGVVQRDVPRILKSLSALRDRLLLFRRISEQCAAYSVFVHRSLVRIWLAFPDSFGAEGLKHYR